MKKIDKLDIKKEIDNKISKSGIDYALGYLMSKSTNLDKDKCLEYVKLILDKKLNEVGKGFVNMSNNKHKLSELSNEDLLKDNDKIIKG